MAGELPMPVVIPNNYDIGMNYIPLFGNATIPGILT